MLKLVTNVAVDGPGTGIVLLLAVATLVGILRKAAMSMVARR